MRNPDVIINPDSTAAKRGGTKTPAFTLLSWVVYAVILAVLYWFLLPPLNWRSGEMWTFIIVALAIRFVMSGFSAIRDVLTNAAAASHTSGKHRRGGLRESFAGFGLLSKVTGVTVGLLVLLTIFGSIVGAQIFNAHRYANLLTYENGDFSTDVAELSMSSIPVVDRDTASRLGLRKLGEMSDLVSQFEVGDYYTQINYKGSPYRVTPLMYGDVFKWLNNQSDGIPAYITVNMVTQETALVRLDEEIRYSDSEYLLRNLNRHLRFAYPTKIFDNITFEIDENGTPYWIASTVKYRIGIWSGRDIGGAVLCNAITGECQYYDVEDVPAWVDQVYSSSMIVEQLTYNGKYQSGFFNSVFGQSGVLQPTQGYNYLAINDDVYLYTGITSVASDESNVGFVLVNLRTKETSYYTCPGAEEYSAMGSAQGVVQDLGYNSTFPILLNVSDRPTYFVSLKDSAGLVKMYAFIDVQQYQVVATGSSIDEARAAYTDKLKTEANIEIEDYDSETGDQKHETFSATGIIERISSAVVDSNTRYYIRLEGDNRIFIADVTVSDVLPFASAADSVTLTCYGDGDSVTVSGYAKQ